MESDRSFGQPSKFSSDSEVRQHLGRTIKHADEAVASRTSVT